jgi:hypothetical protein
MTRKHFQCGFSKSHSIKSSLVPVPETPNVLCIERQKKKKKENKRRIKKVQVKHGSQSRRERKRTPSKRSDERGSPIISTRDEERQVATLENVAHRVEDDARRTETPRLPRFRWRTT